MIELPAEAQAVVDQHNYQVRLVSNSYRKSAQHHRKMAILVSDPRSKRRHEKLATTYDTKATDHLRCLV